MARFGEYLDSLGVGDAGAIMYPDTFDTDIRAAYDADFQGATAQQAMLEQEIATLKAQNMELAAANWNLLQSIPTNNTVEEPEPDEEPDSEDDDTDPSDFFE